MDSTVLTREQERELHKFGRRLIMGTPGLKEALIESVVTRMRRDIFDEPEDEDEATE